MITRKCICGEDFTVHNKYKNYFLVGFEWFGSTECLYNHIMTRPYKPSHHQESTPYLVSQPDVYCAELNKWFRSQIECSFAIWLSYHGLPVQYESVALNLHGRSYTPDFYIAHNRLFIELKGLWSGAGKAKVKATNAEGTSILLLPHYFKQLLDKDIRKGKDNEIFKRRI